MKNDLLSHKLTVEDATELAVNRPQWRLLAASGAMLTTEDDRNLSVITSANVDGIL